MFSYFFVCFENMAINVLTFVSFCKEIYGSMCLCLSDCVVCLLAYHVNVSVNSSVGMFYLSFNVMFHTRQNLT